MHLVLKFWLWGRFVAEKQTFVLNLMAGHLLNMTYNENGKWNVWELDHYTDRSSLGIHFWDLYWKMAYLKFEKFWYSNVRPWETVQIWGDCPTCPCLRRNIHLCINYQRLCQKLVLQSKSWGWMGSLSPKSIKHDQMLVPISQGHRSICIWKFICIEIFFLFNCSACWSYSVLWCMVCQKAHPWEILQRMK